MDVSLASTLVYAKTPKGVAEINARSGALNLQARRVLIMIDGRRPIAELLAVVRTGEFEGIMSTLEQQGMIEKVDVVEMAPNFEDQDFADTISLLEENAAALRAMPDMSAAAIAQATGRGDPNAAHAPDAASASAAALAARAVANASAPRADTVMRRPATIAAPVQEMAVGKARPGTVNLVARSAEPSRPVPPPPTVRAALVADAGGLAVATPVRAAAAQAAAAPAPAPQTPATTRTLEEEKRYVVSALYSVLGPYGEHSVTMLMECKTMEAFREQVKAAGKRVVTFRGEKASQDFLKSIGYA